jgi:hypothetical protein
MRAVYHECRHDVYVSAFCSISALIIHVLTCMPCCHNLHCVYIAILEELEMSIIGTVGDLDSPQTADTKGYLSLKRYLSGVSSINAHFIANTLM